MTRGRAAGEGIRDFAYFEQEGLTGRQSCFVSNSLIGAPEEIRTPDPQIRSLILSNSLTFLGFP